MEEPTFIGKFTFEHVLFIFGQRLRTVLDNLVS